MGTRGKSDGSPIDHHLLADLPVMFVLTRAVDGTAIIDECNERFCETLGYDREELIGEPLRSVYTPASKTKIASDGYARALEDEFSSEERTLLTREDDHVSTLLRAVPRRDDQGNVVGTRALFIDITPQKDRERTLESYETIIEGLDEGTVSIDSDGVIHEANSAFETLTSSPPSEAQGSRVSALPVIEAQPRETATAFTQGVQSVLQGSQNQYTVTLAPAECTDERILNATVTRTNSSPAGAVIVFRDVTETVREKEAIKNQENALRELYTLITEPGTGFDETVNELLEFGCRLLGTEAAFLSTVEGDDWEITHAYGKHPRLFVGRSAPLENTYCRRLLENDQTVNETQIGPESSWPGEDVFEEFGLETYLGVPLYPERDTSRTLCFGSLESRAEPFSDDKKAIIELIGNWITSELERIERQNRLGLMEDALDKATVGITLADADQEETPLVYVNEGFEELTGYSAADVIGETCGFLSGPETDESRVQKVRKAVRNREQVSVELRNYRKDGSVFWNQLDIVPVATDSGETQFLLGIQKDVTEQHAQRDRFRALIEKSSDIITVVDEAGEIRYGSPAVESVLGYNPTELEDENPLLGVHPEDRDRVKTYLEAARDEESLDRSIEYRYLHADGSWRWLETVVNNHLDGEVQGLIFNTRDVTDRKQREAHLNALHRIMRHNMRNDLNIVGGYVDLLQERVEDEVAQTYLDKVDSVIRDWVTTTEKVGFLRQQFQEDTYGTVELERVKSDLLPDLEREFPDVSVSFEEEVPAGTTIPAPTLRVIQELCENVGRHVSGQPSLELSATMAGADNDRIRIDIADDGPGLPSHEQTLLEAGEESPVSHGQGVGLWLVRLLTEQLGGDIAVDVAEDGTTVSIWVPATGVDETE